jgi:hopene-associated glycosyltransferase HpnB
VVESEAAGLAMNSRMARLRCRSLPERLLIPPFLFFFNLLYPMRLVNDPRRRLAAGAGGCVLIRHDALERAGGLEAIRGEVIDDVNLARAVKRSGGRIRLSTSHDDVVSVREYGDVGSVWRMVRRSAFDQLGYSWLLLAGTVLGLVVLFAAPPGLTFAGIALGGAGALTKATAVAVTGLAAAAWLVSVLVYLPTVRYFGLPWPWGLTLPAGGLLYGAMTVDSARVHALGRDRVWS